MRMYDIIEHKKNGLVLTDKEIAFFVNGYTDGTIPDYQASALLMAICLKGMDAHETAVLTDCMAHSGECLDLSAIKGVTADKHSTGGVGDKTTLIVAPICASLGLKIAKMSGRGLGHTGGTIDKLESIEGYNTTLSTKDFYKQVNEIGIALIGQSGDLAPADKKLYALRDVTATVDNYALIAASIMSKKIAAGDKNIVLDVKCGSGAFMKTPEDAKKLANTMVEIGKNCGRNTAAVITNMNMPLGKNIGNALEVQEAIAILKNEGDKELRELCIVLAAHMLSVSLKKSYQECYTNALESIENGKAFQKFRELVKAQGGNVNWIDNPELFPKANIKYTVRSPFSGYIEKTNTQEIGKTAVLLGAGREKKEDTIDLSAGIILNKKPGEKVEVGEALAVFYTSNIEKAKQAEHRFLSALTVSNVPPKPMPLIYENIE